MSETSVTIKIEGEAHSQFFAEQLARVLLPGTVLTLQGDLGAGKTTLSRFIVHALGEQGPVTSPTYTIVEPHQIDDKLIYHFDLYRLENESELEELGFDEYFEEAFLNIIEWPERAGDSLPPVDLALEINFAKEDDHRLFTLRAKSDKGQTMLTAMQRKH